MARAIFIDRDGVLIKEPPFDPTIGPASEAINSWEKFEILPRVGRAFSKLKGEDYRIFVITNQEGIDEGFLSYDFFNETNDKIREFISDNNGAAIDHIYVCPHPIGGGCGCRKPKRGLIDQALKDYPDIELSKSWFIGDRPTDIKLGKSIKVKTIAVRANYGLPDNVKPDFVVNDIEEAVDVVLKEDNS